MSDQVISLKVDSKLKDQASKVAQDLGIPLATYLKLCLKKICREQRIEFSRLEVPRIEVARRWKSQNKDIKNGENLSDKFGSIEAFKADLEG